MEGRDEFIPGLDDRRMDNLKFKFPASWRDLLTPPATPKKCPRTPSSAELLDGTSRLPQRFTFTDPSSPLHAILEHKTFHVNTQGHHRSAEQIHSVHMPENYCHGDCNMVNKPAYPEMVSSYSPDSKGSFHFSTDEHVLKPILLKPPPRLKSKHISPRLTERERELIESTSKIKVRSGINYSNRSPERCPSPSTDVVIGENTTLGPNGDEFDRIIDVPIPKDPRFNDVSNIAPTNKHKQSTRSIFHQQKVRQDNQEIQSPDSFDGIYNTNPRICLKYHGNNCSSGRQCDLECAQCRRHSPIPLNHSQTSHFSFPITSAQETVTTATPNCRTNRRENIYFNNDADGHRRSYRVADGVLSTPSKRARFSPGDYHASCSPSGRCQERVMPHPTPSRIGNQAGTRINVHDIAQESSSPHSPCPYACACQRINSPKSLYFNESARARDYQRTWSQSSRREYFNPDSCKRRLFQPRKENHRDESDSQITDLLKYLAKRDCLSSIGLRCIEDAMRSPIRIPSLHPEPRHARNDAIDHDLPYHILVIPKDEHLSPELLSPSLLRSWENRVHPMLRNRSHSMNESTVEQTYDTDGGNCCSALNHAMLTHRSSSVPLMTQNNTIGRGKRKQDVLDDDFDDLDYYRQPTGCYTHLHHHQNEVHCECKHMEEQIMRTAREAYAHVRRKDDSTRAFEQFEIDLQQTNDNIMAAMSNLRQLKLLCRKCSVDID